NPGRWTLARTPDRVSHAMHPRSTEEEPMNPTASTSPAARPRGADVPIEVVALDAPARRAAGYAARKMRGVLEKEHRPVLPARRPPGGAPRPRGPRAGRAPRPGGGQPPPGAARGRRPPPPRGNRGGGDPPAHPARAVRPAPAAHAPGPSPRHAGPGVGVL